MREFCSSAVALGRGSSDEGKLAVRAGTEGTKSAVGAADRGGADAEEVIVTGATGTVAPEARDAPADQARARADIGPRVRAGARRVGSL